MSKFVPKQSQWTRCSKCGYCNYVVWEDCSVHPGGTYTNTGCKICRYSWSKSVLTQSLVNRMKMEFQRASGKDVFGPEEPIKSTLWGRVVGLWLACLVGSRVRGSWRGVAI